MRHLILICFAVFSLTVISCKGEQKEQEREHKEMAMKDQYQCPMDCEKGKTYDKDGQCPVCKMNLKKKEVKSEAHGHDHGDAHKHSEDKSQNSKEGDEHQHKKGDGHNH